ncbi:hypothetical protein ACIOEZ_16580 [Streptomyces sp. NPDC087866]|uniref:hypothetical protein n=1 Tax=unclassified Streptomyces TaxID=2593676 RepID=UPI0033AFAEE9
MIDETSAAFDALYEQGEDYSSGRAREHGIGRPEPQGEQRAECERGGRDAGGQKGQEQAEAGFARPRRYRRVYSPGRPPSDGPPLATTCTQCTVLVLQRLDASRT